MSLAIEKEAEVTFDFDYETLAKDVISFTMEHEHFPFEAEISLTLTDNEGIWKVNKEFREIYEYYKKCVRNLLKVRRVMIALSRRLIRVFFTM